MQDAASGPGPDRPPIAYLVITHSMPDHLGRLIAALSDDATDFFVHVDRKVDIGPFLELRGRNVTFFQDRVPVFWGEWQMVDATLRLIRAALATGRDHSHFVLLSGSCYPIRSREYIRSFLVAHDGEQLINAIRMPSVEANKPLSRIDRFHRRSDQSTLELLRRIAVELPHRHAGRPFSKGWLLSRDWAAALGPLRPFGGSSWWALTGDAVRYIEAFASERPKVMRFFENSRSPDEIVFQTILGNSPFADAMRRGPVFADWSAGGSHPAVLSERHLGRFARPGPMLAGGPYGDGEFLFARKFPDDGGVLAGQVDAIVRERGIS